MVKVFVIYYSTYGHVAKLADTIAKSAATVAGVDVKLWQVAETLSDDILGKMHAPAKKAEVPVIQAADLAEADAFLIGFPTRYGAFPSQVKALFDATGGLWSKGALVGKPFGFFTSTGNLGGGQETTIQSALSFVVHHGGIFVPVGYTSPLLFDNSEPRGGSPWGPGTFTNGDGSRQPSEKELQITTEFGVHFSKIARDLAAGRAANSK
ncbi:flavoprotein wrbA [Capsaspora owczarzaki ATCC 30864]|uniref:Flavoprotein wrbA n=1 Tax=Capsaspora owczarzaki (strain ATCC 30864) TaxID=595528 RepID=A0A0D2X465_CAPO3|nr:flavoprotein wrbA [Capsaspora owczarzaki ATCC 30864]KJE95519.1 flavoprotein wrbA [Capsaspora owczarzaki ATCC 30864]|eukprot:XP_004345558.1 flavoprotein wrbA [Capsaspora owczarzaki ATCC 30864]